MRVLLDENLLVGLAALLGNDHQIDTVAGLRWQGVSNGELLVRMEGRFDVLFTMDRGIAYQQALRGRLIAILTLRAWSNRMSDLRRLVPETLTALEGVRHGTVRILGA